MTATAIIAILVIVFFIGQTFLSTLKVLINVARFCTAAVLMLLIMQQFFGISAPVDSINSFLNDIGNALRAWQIIQPESLA